MPSRKWHSKGRHGCGQCKQRRVKCDVRYHVCSNFTEVAPMPINVGQLLSIDPGNPVVQMWKPIINNLIHTHVFLQHGYEASTMLHTRKTLHLTSLGDYLEAYQKHISALQDFRKISTRSDWVASVLFAMIVSVFEMGVAGIQPGEGFIPNTIIALRNGAQLTRAIAPNFVKERQRDEIMKAKPFDDAESLLMVKYIESEFEAVGGMTALDTIYQQAIVSLRLWILRVDARPKSWGHVMWWPANLDDKFVDLVRGKDHLATVVARQWAYIISRLSGVWFLDGWSHRAHVSSS
ncbi:hypothetical protein NW768_001127 [Fusarium equiseti]|uniref:Zn(2)-C6 fungal-type domain-containing protein n=1 Tax=Fusarium equiseti TaxID=61235 RepID=A0ABQ8RPC2_FUSEQ|nr:hypothetical protein NW768_001127 [Fusarium equiseti]